MENLNLVRKIVWSFHKSSGHDWDDLFQEAYIAYNNAMKNYDPNKGKISTHLWHCISNDLINYLKHEKIITELICPIEDNPVDYAIDLDPFFETLSKEASDIADIILVTSNKFVCLSSEQVIKRIENILLRQGWSKEKIQTGIKNLRIAYNY